MEDTKIVDEKMEGQKQTVYDSLVDKIQYVDDNKYKGANQQEIYDYLSGLSNEKLISVYKESQGNCKAVKDFRHQTSIVICDETLEMFKNARILGTSMRISPEDIIINNIVYDKIYKRINSYVNCLIVIEKLEYVKNDVDYSMIGLCFSPQLTTAKKMIKTEMEQLTNALNDEDKGILQEEFANIVVERIKEIEDPNQKENQDLGVHVPAVVSKVKEIGKYVGECLTPKSSKNEPETLKA